MPKPSPFTPSQNQGLLTSPCLAMAKKTFTISEQQAEELFLEMMGKYETVKANSGDADYRVKFQEIVKDESFKARQIAKSAKIAARKNPLKRRGMLTAIELDGLDADNVNHRFFAALVGAVGRARQYTGKSGTLQGLGKSIGALQDSRYFDIMAKFYNELGMSRKEYNKHFRLPVFMTGLDGKPTAKAIARMKLVRDVITEMFGPEGQGYNIDKPKSYTGNEIAFKTATAIVKAKHELIKKLQGEGVPIGWLPNHVTSQYHDAIKIGDFSGKTADKWVDEILPLLDHKRTFSADMSDADKRVMLSNIYFNIIEGKRTSVDMTGDVGRSGVGKKSIGNLLAQSRVLHFANPDAWMKYNELFGHDDPFNAIMQGLKNLSDDTVLIETMGTNPDDSFARLKSEISRKVGREFKVGTIDAAWAQVTGEAYRTVWGKNAQNINRFRQIMSSLMNMSSLGATIFPSISDVPYAIGGLRKNGMGFFSAMNKQMEFQMRALKGSLSDAEIQQVARMVSVGMDGMIGTLHSRNGGDDVGWGMLSRMQEQFYDLNLLSGWTDAARTGFGMTLSNHVGTSLSKSWKNIDAGLRSTLEEYGIDAGHWEIMRQVGTAEVEGNTFFTPDLIDEFKKNLELSRRKIEIIPGEEIPYGDQTVFIDKERAAAIQRVKKYIASKPDQVNLEVLDQARDRIGQYFYTEVRNAIIESGKAEKALMYGNSRPGTIDHAVRSMFFTFKGFPIAYIRRVLPRYINEGARFWAPQIIALTATGYAGLMLRDMTMGRQPRSPLDPKVAMQAFLYSGAGTMVADLVVNDYRQYGRGAADYVLGPAYSKIVKPSSEIMAAIVNGDFEDALDRSFQAGYKMVPYNNHFLFRAALDGAILNSGKEWLNPGSLQRKERRIRSEGYDFLPGMSPTEFNFTR